MGSAPFFTALSRLACPLSLPEQIFVQEGGGRAAAAWSRFTFTFVFPKEAGTRARILTNRALHSRSLSAGSTGHSWASWAQTSAGPTSTVRTLLPGLQHGCP